MKSHNKGKIPEAVGAETKRSYTCYVVTQRISTKHSQKNSHNYKSKVTLGAVKKKKKSTRKKKLENNQIQWKNSFAGLWSTSGHFHYIPRVRILQQLWAEGVPQGHQRRKAVNTQSPGRIGQPPPAKVSEGQLGFSRLWVRSNNWNSSNHH